MAKMVAMVPAMARSAFPRGPHAAQLTSRSLGTLPLAPPRDALRWRLPRAAPAERSSRRVATVRARVRKCLQKKGTRFVFSARQWGSTAAGRSGGWARRAWRSLPASGPTANSAFPGGGEVAMPDVAARRWHYPARDGPAR